MNVTTAVLEIRARLQELVADFWTSVEVYNALNEACRRFSAQEKWPWLYTVGSDLLVAGATKLDLPAGVSFERVFALGLTFADDSRIRTPRRVSPVEGFRLRQQFYTAASEPLVYYIVSESGTGNELQTLANAGDTAGTFTLTYSGQTTAVISRAATAATIQAALVALSNIGADDVTCYGGPLGTATVFIRFRGALGAADVAALTLGGTTTSLTAATSSAGGANTGEYVTNVRFLPTLTRDATVEYLYIRDSRNLTTDTDVLDVPEEYAMGAVAYATGLLWLKELRDSRKADEQFGLYAQVVDDAKRESRKLSPDRGLAWGRNEPEMGSISGDDYTYQHFTGLLGP